MPCRGSGGDQPHSRIEEGAVASSTGLHPPAASQRWTKAGETNTTNSFRHFCRVFKAISSNCGLSPITDFRR